MKHVLISGYYGFDNAGDEAVLAGLITGLRAAAPPGLLDIAALSIAPEKTQRLHGIPAKHRYKQVIPALMRSNLLMSGGGSLLQDVTSAHGIFYYLAVVRMAQILGCKTMFVAQGIGPLTRERSIKLTASVANGLDGITVRDQASCTLLETIGVTRPINITADPALLLQAAVPSKRDGILLSLRPWRKASPTFAADLAGAFARVGLPREVMALSMHGEGDAAAAWEVLDLMQTTDKEPAVLGKSQSFREILNVVASAELVIGMRLHALIFAVAAGVPVVGLSYDPKVNAFLGQIGQDDAIVDIAKTDQNKLASVIDDVWHSRHDRAELLRKRLPSLRQSAQRNADIAYNLLR